MAKLDNYTVIMEERPDLLWLYVICIYHLRSIQIFFWDITIVIYSKECNVEPAHAVEELEDGHIECTGVKSNPLYPVTLEQTTEEKVLKQSGAKVTCHARIEHAIITLVFQLAVMLIGECLDHHSIFQIREVTAKQFWRRYFICY